MKPGIHPEYREIVFVDVSNNFSFKTRSTMSTKEKIKWEDGNEYPLAKIETSSESHPFYTGTQKIMDTAGRVEKSVRNSVPRLLLSLPVMALLKQLRKKLPLQKLKLLKRQLRRRLKTLQVAGYEKYLLCEIIKAAFAAFFIFCFTVCYTNRFVQNKVHG